MHGTTNIKFLKDIISNAEWHKDYKKWVRQNAEEVIFSQFEVIAPDWRNRKLIK